MTAPTAQPTFSHVEPVKQTMGHAYDFTSSITGRDYRVFVDVPGGEPPAGGFPVVYLLDGNLHFTPFVGMARGFAIAGETKPAVVIGIGYPGDDPVGAMTSRFKDLSLPASEAWIAGLGWTAPGMTVDNTGGVDAFLSVMEREIRPAVADLAKVDPTDQALFGHSLAGHAVLRALFTAPGSYRAFIASSPSIWWAEAAVLGEEAALGGRLTAAGAKPRVLLAVGEREAFPDRAALAHFATREEAEASLARSRMVGNVVDLGARLSTVPGCVVSTVVFSGEGHATVIPAALCRALQFAVGVE